MEITPRAAKEIHGFFKQKSLDSTRTFMRISVRPGGCSGFLYDIDLTHDDGNAIVQDVLGIKVVCDERSFALLDGVTLDFREELMGRGFRFINPDARVCECGVPCPMNCPGTP